MAIAENENEDINLQICEFIKKCGEIVLKMMISDPPMLFDCRQIGMKVNFNQHKFESLDGFIKASDECLVILPVHVRDLDHIVGPEDVPSNSELTGVDAYLAREGVAGS